MSSPNPSTPSRNASSSSLASNALTSTSAAPTQHQYSQVSTANDSRSSSSSRAAQTDDIEAYFALRHPPIPQFKPPPSTKFGPKPKESLGSLDQRNRPAESSFEPAERSRAGTGTNPQPTADAEHRLHDSIARICRRRRDTSEAQKQPEATTQAHRRDDNASAAYYRTSTQATPRREPFAYASGVSTIRRGRGSEQYGALSGRLTAKPTRLGSQYQGHIPISIPPFSTFPTPQHEVPSLADRLGAQGEAWVRKKQAKGKKKYGHRYVVGK